MRTILMVLIFDLIVALSPPAQAQQQMTGTRAEQPSRVQALNGAAKRPPMSLKQFEDFALAKNPTLKQAADFAQVSKALARQAGLYPNPVAGYEGGEIRGGSFGGGEQGAFVQQTIVLGGKLGLRKRVFQAQQKEGEAGIAVQRYRVISDVEQRFYSALAAQGIIGLRQTILNVTRDAAETAHQLANVGQADLPDVLQAEVEADEARVEFATAQLNYIRAFKTLAATSGRPDQPISWLEGDLTAWPEINPQQVIATILRNSPAVARAQASVTRAEAVLHSARREAIPDIQFRAGVQQDNQALNEDAPRLKPVGVVGFASVGVNIPIFNRNQGNVAAAQDQIERAREEVTRVQLSLRRAAEPLLQGYLADRTRASQYKSDIIPKATRAYQLYLNKYRQMAAAYPEVLVSQRTWLQLEVRYARTLEDLWKSAIALQNFTLENGLQSPAPAGEMSITGNLPDSGNAAGGG